MVTIHNKEIIIFALFFAILLINMASFVQATTVFDTNLIAYYNFDEASGTTVTDSTTNNLNGNGSFAGGTGLGFTGILGNAYYSNSSSNYISLPDSSLFKLNKKFTIAYWEKSTNATTGAYPFSTGYYGPTNGYGIVTKVAENCFGEASLRESIIAINGSPTGALDLNHVCTSKNVVDNQWHFFVATYDGNCMVTYIDNNLDSYASSGNVGYPSTCFPPPNYTSPNTVVIGNWKFNGNFNHGSVGYIDEMAIFDKNFDPTDVNYLWNNGVGRTYSATPASSDSNAPITTFYDYGQIGNAIDHNLGLLCTPNSSSNCYSLSYQINTNPLVTITNSTGNQFILIDGNKTSFETGTLTSNPDLNWTAGTATITTTLAKDGTKSITNPNGLITTNISPKRYKFFWLNFSITTATTGMQLKTAADAIISATVVGQANNTWRYFNAGAWRDYDNIYHNPLVGRWYLVKVDYIDGAATHSSYIYDANGTLAASFLNQNVQTVGTVGKIFLDGSAGGTNYFDGFANTDTNYTILNYSITTIPTSTIYTNFLYHGVGNHTINYYSIGYDGNTELTNTNTFITTDYNIPINVVVKYPLDEQTLIAIDHNWGMSISGCTTKNYPTLNTDKNVTVYTGIACNFIVTDSNVGTYFSRTYTLTFTADQNNYVLQPYLVPTTTGLLTTINTIDSLSILPVSGINIKIYKNIVGLGRTYVEEITTDDKGQALVLLVLNANYDFDIYQNSAFLRTDAITATSNTIYVKIPISIGLDRNFTYYSINTIFNPSRSKLITSDKNLKQTITLTNSGTSAVTISSIKIWATNEDINGINGNDRNLYLHLFTSPSSPFINGIDLNVNGKKIDGNKYDTNGGLNVYVLVTLSDGNTFLYFYKYSLPGVKSFKEGLSIDVKGFFGCSTSDPLMPCGGLLLVSLFLALIFTIGLAIEVGATNMEAMGIMFLAFMGLFTFFEWIPYLLYGIMIITFVVIEVAIGGNRV